MVMVQVITFSERQQENIRQSLKGIRFLLNEGTPRSGKTTADAFLMANFYVNSPDKNHLISAYNQEQAYRMFIDGDGLGLAHIFAGVSDIKHDEHGDHLLLHAPNGEKKIYYKGGGKANSVGAITGMSLGSVSFLEYNLLHPDFIQESFRRTMAAEWRFHLAEQNPPAPNHPNLELYERFEKAGTFKFVHWTPYDNPRLAENNRLEELKAELIVSDYLYKRDWLGERVMPEGVIYSMFDKDKHVVKSMKGNVVETFFTTDAGQSDATTCAFWAVTFYKGDYYLYRLANYYHSGADTGRIKAMSTYAKDIKIFIEWCYTKYSDLPRWNYFFVDPAAKSLREELHLINIYTDKADNNTSDKVTSNGTKIEVGIERTQNLMEKGRLFLVDTDEYDHYGLIKELGMYVRNDGGYPVDKNNHACDELRYGCNYFFKNYVR